MEPKAAGAPPTNVVVHCRNLLIGRDPGVQWLIGSPFLPPFTVLSTFRCLHYLPGDSFSPDISKEADDLKVMLLRGFDIIGALYVGDANLENIAARAAEAIQLRKVLFGQESNGDIIGATANLTTSDVMFYIAKPGTSIKLEAVSEVKYENNSGKTIWELGCLIRCELLIKCPVYIPLDKKSDAKLFVSSAMDALADKLKAHSTTYIVEGINHSTESKLQPVIIRSSELDFQHKKPELKLKKSEGANSSSETISCAYFFPKNISASSISSQNAEPIRVTAFINHSKDVSEAAAPVAHYFPASEPASLKVINLKLDVLCFSAKEFPVASALSVLVIPGLTDQIYALKHIVASNLQAGHPQLRPYHFFPAGIRHPITSIYELSYGETEKKLADTRRSLHLRLGLPLDRPLLRIANALTFGSTKMNEASPMLPKDVHLDISGSGVIGGLPSLIQGSYEYYHYLQDGFDDNGWGCAYRSLQTIISWFKLQQYTSIQVPSHREIQQALVEIGDKEPSFIGSRDWIGAIELSFVLDKLLGVSCKVINVRSGSELPEKCRELALHFETQGTPIMIGGGVLAYTLLGVDYNDANGDCAFLILDPHYTGTDDLKRILGGGWCGWKKAVDSKGKKFFLHDKFYNLLLPQRPNMV